MIGCGGSSSGPASAEDVKQPSAQESAEAERIYQQLTSCAAAVSTSGITLRCDGFAIQLGTVVIEDQITDDLLRETESIAIGGVEKSWGIPVEREAVDLGGIPGTQFPPPDDRHPGGVAVSTAVSASNVLITVCLGPPCSRLMGTAQPFFRAVDRFLDEHPPRTAGTAPS